MGDLSDNTPIRQSLMPTGKDPSMLQTGSQPYDFVHQKLNQEIYAIGGRYFFSDEMRLPFKGRDILVLVGSAVFDTTCCGYAGFGYALVPGFVLDWKYKTDPDGAPVSRLEPVQRDSDQKEIRTLIKQKESIEQVNFR